MRNSGNFHPEWGYLAPAPSFMRTARIVIVATAIGATAGAGVVLSLVERPSASAVAEAGKKLVVVHSLVQPATSAAAATAQNPPSQPFAERATTTAPVDAKWRATVTAPSLGAASTQASSAAASPPAATQAPAPIAAEAGAVSTPATPASIAALAETSAAASPATAPDIAAVPDQTTKDSKQRRAAEGAASHGSQNAEAKRRSASSSKPLPLLQRIFGGHSGT